MTNFKFETWRKDNPYIEDHLHFPDGEASGWGRVYAKWHEKHDGIDLTHICAFTLDLHSGELYLDCTKRKIWTKCLCLTAGRLFFGLTKTVYHLALPISIPFEILKAVIAGIEHQDSAKTIAQNAAIKVCHNAADIFRTPIYSVVLTIIALAGVIIGPFAPCKLYDLRALAGRIENALNRGEESWTLAPCFQPIEDITSIETLIYSKSDTVYDQEAGLHRLNNLARAYVGHRRAVRNPFDDYCRLVKQDGAYISPACAS